MMRIFIHIEILADSNVRKCLKAIKCSERRVETLQIIFYFLQYLSFYLCCSHFFALCFEYNVINHMLLCKCWINSHFYFIIVEKILFWGQTFELEILMSLHVLRSPEYENHIFSGWCVCICVCYQHNSKASYAETSILAFYICITCRCNSKFFMNIGQKFCIQGHKKEL